MGFRQRPLNLSRALCCASLALVASACDRSPVAASAQPPASEASGELPLPPPAANAAPRAATVPQRISGEAAAMGTHVVYAAYTTDALDEAAVRAAFDAATAELKRIEDLMTTWRDSELSRVNQAAGREAVAVGKETFFVLQRALHTSRLSGGAFDVTFETLHGLWKFDEDLEPVPPAPAALKKRLAAVGYDKLQLDESRQTVYLRHKDTRVGLGGIAKGYGVDRAAKVLREAGLRSFFVQAGGDLYAEGKKPDGAPWTAGIRDPRGPAQRYFAVIALENRAFSTAGDYERSYVIDNKRYHHILDPHTGYPATACRSVTVWAETALQADELDDAVFVLGPEKGIALIESQPGVGAVIVDAKNQVWISDRLRDKIQLTAHPTDAP